MELKLPNIFLSDPSEKEIGRENPEVSEKGGNIMVTMWEKLFTFKRVVKDQLVQLVQYFRGSNSERTRVYQVWPGKNVFFFHGRLICGPEPRGLVLTTFSIILSSWIFAVYVGGDLPSHSRLIIAISMILTIIVLVNLIMLTVIEPGIIPRNDQLSIEDAGTSDGTKSRKIIVNGVDLKLKYCRVCKIYRPPRSCHCAICDNCVEKYDHHCPLVGQCIALRNYRFFLAFVVSALVFFVYIFAFSCWRIHLRILRNGTGLFGLLKNCPETVALILFGAISIGFLGGLVLFHVYLTTKNQTAYENFRQSYVGSKNPFDKGILNNIKEFLFVPLPPSRVDFRAEVTPRWSSTAASVV
ncbi:probable protein S-acyltransferase 6 [Quercus lobata]|uniref:S-acyltransferase n=1 Tax=Quercus lobata TaxID=97700 RepID=A0A7N2MAT3_QUELO|nr:probable protein S-acyltransferase 6 [Quercus lobata]